MTAFSAGGKRKSEAPLLSVTKEMIYLRLTETEAGQSGERGRSKGMRLPPACSLLRWPGLGQLQVGNWVNSIKVSSVGGRNSAASQGMH